jgi:hypothetical protein
MVVYNGIRSNYRIDEGKFDAILVINGPNAVAG